MRSRCFNIKYIGGGWSGMEWWRFLLHSSNSIAIAPATEALNRGAPRQLEYQCLYHRSYPASLVNVCAPRRCALFRLISVICRDDLINKNNRWLWGKIACKKPVSGRKQDELWGIGLTSPLRPFLELLDIVVKHGGSCDLLSQHDTI